MRLRCRNCLVAFTGNNLEQVRILSTVARLSGGCYDSLPEIVKRWKKYKGELYRFNEPFSAKEEEEIIREYMTPMLLCSKPDSINMGRWFIKCLSNDQTAFTGFTSLVEVVESEEIGYDGAIKLLPSASFAESFVLEEMGKDADKLIRIQEKINKMDSGQAQDINNLIKEAEFLCPIRQERKKGKSPIFFYGVTDKAFKIPISLYARLKKITEEAYLSLKSALYEWDLRNFRIESNRNRNAFTGSIDFMIFGDDIYIIDIGAPAIGYIADIVKTCEALGRNPEIGIEKIAQTIGSRITIARNRLSKELGFFKFEKEYLVNQLKNKGIDVAETEDEEYEAIIEGEKMPDKLFDYLSRNQPVRNKILSSSEKLQSLGAKIPEGTIALPDDFFLARFYESTRIGEDYGLLIKKRVLFREYDNCSSYFKPLVAPIWGKELGRDKKRSNLFEQFIPNLIETDILGDRKGKRCYEIRMYFVAGDSR